MTISRGIGRTFNNFVFAEFRNKFRRNESMWHRVFWDEVNLSVNY